MISEGIHSVVDTISQVLLIWGVKASKRKADEARPFGYGKDFYFWSFIVALIIFTVGGCISIYQGLNRLKSPKLDDNPTIDYIILMIAFVFNFVSMVSAYKAFNKQRREENFWRAVIKTKDPSTIIVLLGDVGDLLGIIVAFIGIYLAQKLKNPYYDGLASIIIGAILIIISSILIRVTFKLLIGRTVSKKYLTRVVAIAKEDETVKRVRKPYSTFLSPEDILLQLNIVFDEKLDTNEITDAIQRIVTNIQKEFPLMKQIFITPVKSIKGSH